MTCEQSLCNLMREGFDVVLGLSNTLAFEVNNGLLIAQPQSSIIIHMIDLIASSFHKE